MIYYYFGDKEGLYLAALEDAYRTVRVGEAKLDVEGLSPVEALRKLVEFTFDHHHRHEDFIRMVMIENIHHGEYLERSKEIRRLNISAIDTMESVYRRGVTDGVRVNAINPGTVVTERLAKRIRQTAADKGIDEAAAVAAMIQTARVSRFGEPAEIARAVAFLASPQNGYCQGNILDIDGGTTRTL